MTPITGSNLINGQWIASAAGAFKAMNPATGEALSPAFSEAAEADVNAAAKAAVEAFALVGDLSPRWPADLVDTIADRIMDLGDALLERAEAESALPRPRLTGERARTIGQLKMFASIARDGGWIDAVIDTADPSRAPMPKPDLRRMLRPRGPVAVFGASNFPLAFGALGGDTASALAAGCPVIVKGHPSHPGTSELVAQAVLAALQERKFPLGLFALLQGRSHGLSGALVKHPLITAVGFTGSLKAGRALFDMAAARPSPIPVYAEMGSLNPLVILPGAIAERADRIAQELAGSVLMGGGQFCTKPGVILTLGDADAFVDALSAKIGAAPPVTMLNQPLRDSFIARTSHWPKLAGVQVRVAPRAVDSAAAVPGLLDTSADSFNHQPELREEAFGPAALVVRCDDMMDVKRTLESIGGSLTGTIHIGSGDDAKPVLKLMESIVGRVVINGYPTGVEVNNAIVHGGPYPATTDAGSTSVGAAAIKRWARLIAYQDMPDSLLPPELQNANPLKIDRLVNGQRSAAAI